MKYNEGDKYICGKCETEVIVKKINYHGEEKLSHRNPDNSPHFFFDGKKYLHTPTKSREVDIQFEEVWEAIRRIENQLGIVRVE